MKKIFCFVFLCMAFSAVYGQQELSVEDSRSTPTTPLQYNFKLKPSFKFNTVLGLNAPGFYSTVLGIRGWEDDSGGKAHELAFTDADLYIRSGYDAGWEAWRKIITTDGKGYVGIGKSEPQTQLEVAPPSSNVSAGIFHSNGGQAWGHVLALVTDFGFGDNPKLLFSYRNKAKQWAIGGGYDSSSFSIWEDGGDGVYGSGFGNARFTILPEGNVGIGTDVPTDKLSVNGNIRAKEIKVETANWPDYVFEEDYSLTSLPEIEAFIKTNKHLPDIPSAQKITEEGLSVGEINKLMMKKIEELTLYLIEKDKEVHKLSEKMTEMEKEIIALKKINN
ncbi:tail fiber protein [Sphingobacterium spiritivorum]|uniref:tail fiber protein n=1 Tax=Sphingobacterium spiritivorum TaxID=258 RepID=UPI00191A2960|nr:tail fiber protein [Sphingobacterium spiritivorum]QQT24837.1 hypothetical protein I6J02_13965 [Sphingobacterium spiritivorum]